MRRTAAAAVLMLCSCGSEPVEETFDAGGGVHPSVQRYPMDVAAVWRAAEEVAAEDEVTIERRRRRGPGGFLLGRRVDGRRMRVAVRELPEGAAEAEVCLDPGNRELAGEVQVRIGEKLSLRKARSELFGERSVEGTYAADLNRCMEAAEKTCRALDLEVVHRQLEESGGLLEARDVAGRAVRIALKPSGARGATGSVLSVDGGETDLLRRLRGEFDRQLTPTAD